MSIKLCWLQLETVEFVIASNKGNILKTILLFVPHIMKTHAYIVLTPLNPTFI